MMAMATSPAVLWVTAHLVLPRDENTSAQIGHPLDGSLCLPLRFGRISPKRLHPPPDRHGCEARRSMLHVVDKDGARAAALARHEP